MLKNCLCSHILPKKQYTMLHTGYIKKKYFKKLQITGIWKTGYKKKYKEITKKNIFSLSVKSNTNSEYIQKNAK